MSHYVLKRNLRYVDVAASCLVGRTHSLNLSTDWFLLQIPRTMPLSKGLQKYMGFRRGSLGYKPRFFGHSVTQPPKINERIKTYFRFSRGSLYLLTRFRLLRERFGGRQLFHLDFLARSFLHIIMGVIWRR